jgi:predicted amino acid racemase
LSLPQPQPTARELAPVSAAASKIGEPAGRIAEVTYSHGQIGINADNSSLNQILRDISRLTGMKITGTVADERVFGRYGPASPTKIMESLLDGTGINMLLLENASGTPANLILTPREGGASPPNLAAQQAPDPAQSISGAAAYPGANSTQNPETAGASSSASLRPPETAEQMQQRLQQAQQAQQLEFQRRQQASHP